jgi:hypothetical protein
MHEELVIKQLILGFFDFLPDQHRLSLRYSKQISTWSLLTIRLYQGDLWFVCELFPLGQFRIHNAPSLANSRKSRIECQTGENSWILNYFIDYATNGIAINTYRSKILDALLLQLWSWALFEIKVFAVSYI